MFFATLNKVLLKFQKMISDVNAKPPVSQVCFRKHKITLFLHNSFPFPGDKWKTRAWKMRMKNNLAFNGKLK